jgi:hypothetical protein
MFESSLHFHSDTNASLDAAEGKTPMPPPSSKTALSEVSDNDEEMPVPSGSSSLMMVSKMLSLPGFDAFLCCYSLPTVYRPGPMWIDYSLLLLCQ